MIYKYLKIILFVFLINIFLVFGAFSKDNSNLSILHINDANGNLEPVIDTSLGEENNSIGGFPRVAYFVEKFRQSNPNTLFFAAGDMIAPIPISARSNGEITIHLMNLLGLDVWSPGNYDFLYGFGELNDRIKEAKFQVVNTNIFLKGSNQNWLKPYVILEKGGKKIAVLGVSSVPFFDTMPQDVRDSLDIRDALETVKPIAKELKDKVDLIVLLAQLSIEKKSEILKKTDVDLIVGSLGTSEEADMTSFSTSDGKLSVITKGYALSVGQVDIEFSNDKNQKNDTSLLPAKHEEEEEFDDDDDDDDDDDKKNDRKKFEAIYHGKGNIVYKNVIQNFLMPEKYPMDVVAEKVPKVYDTLEGYKKGFKDRIIAHFDVAPTLDESYKFVSNVLRNYTGSDVSVLPKNFFLRGSKFPQDLTKEAIFTVIHLPFKPVRVKLSGSNLKAFISNQEKQNLVITGYDKGKINGVGIKDSESYYLCTNELYIKSQLFLKERGSISNYDKSISNIVFEYIEKNKDRTIFISELNNYNSWKFGANLDLDPQIIYLNIQPERDYKYLSWRDDKNSARWGGLLKLFLRRYWDKNEFESTLDAEFRQQLKDNEIEKYSDSFVFDGIYRRQVIENYIVPFLETKISTVFINKDPLKPHLLLGEFNAGLTHDLPFGFKIREGIGTRKNILDQTVPWEIGGVFGINWNQNIFFFREYLDAKLYVPYKFNFMITEVENKLSIPVSSFLSIFYKVNVYSETLDFKDLAFKHNIGITVGLDNPISF